MIEPARVAAILLAAGRSLRFGPGNKLMSDWRGEPLVRHAARAIEESGFGAFVAVVQRDADEVVNAIGPVFTVVTNGSPEAGLSHSIALGIERVAALDVDAGMICLGDMPLVGAALLSKLCARYDDRDDIVAVTDGDFRSPPALFGRRHFDRLLRLSGDSGARDLIAKAVCITAPPGSLLDIDR